jgi:hypothetical protein
MRPRNEAARHALVAALSRRAGVGAAELAAEVGVSIPTLHRCLHEIEASVVVTGKARRTRYALRRPLRGDLADLPLYEVDATGRAELLSSLALVQPRGACMALAETGWPVPDESRDGWWDGLPYPLHDMRPQGYLGRQLARAEHGALSVAANPEAWSDDDVAHVLSRIGHDTSGNLILGNPAFERWQAGRVAPPEPISPRALGRAYARLAEQAIATGVHGSSAAGEFPKFPARRDLAGSDTPHVLVKFSGADGSPAVRRWADLLVCEHLALQAAARLPGVRSARSRIVEHGGRTFLEVERFDRHGPWGRSRLASLATLDAALLGDGSTDWVRMAQRLARLGLLAAAEVGKIEHMWWFGRLIGNSDMHTGNLSFRPQGTLSLAPTYDMLPMRYAPLPGGEVPARDFVPPLPLPPQRPVWLAAAEAASSFWQQASTDSRISARFRALCAANAVAIEDAASRA